ncbi:dihydroxy-acid dehydratase [Aurantimonas sp. C2-6-R+9]|uniref:dihydroxy-acid dehydratase n=1 Tax=unclassified Aurantimonas TaxID=2638230 RepID=UPI002E195A2D|nr:MULTISPECIES: dihydroxy-acid dehydratase [unclassified Aurantimonas]MEC5291141.1 dihydroxy-acid dehydratase [Aurantimonas sp. C2-3-R2]MEC5381468.1 dihydroxy-acid dehydratase [Aurantimonas sp. C2-6-R+9]MEC5411897.1 dihydroxy-acid dehydratase [Aurantimonas sp. C2-4-R8]
MSEDEARGFARGLTNYGDKDFSLYLRNSFASSMGYSREVLKKPIVGIANSFSGFNNCHRHFPEMLEAVKRGVLLGGALPIEFPTISLGEVFLNPTSLKFRNLMSMDTEEMIRAQPMDAVVLMGGCDKTVPAQLMGAASADLPAIQIVAGPMMTSRYGEERLGACTDCRRFWGKYRAGEISSDVIGDIEGRLATTAGTCAVMGTASTMACIAETLGMSLPGTAAIPAVHADRLRAAEATGLAAARMIDNPIRPSEVITEKSVENALRILLALGGSTNAIIHLTAIAGRLGIPVSLRRLNQLSDETPVLVNLKPVGANYMEDFFFAGGVGAVLRELKPLLHLDCKTVTGDTLGDRLREDVGPVDRKVIASAEQPLEPEGGLVALFGNLAPGGAILKRSAADKALFEKEGRAVVFDSLADLAKRIDDPDLDVEEGDILVLQNAGPRSDSGMPEAGYLPIPKKLSAKGVKDMIRISDARMSGTAFGTIVLHVTPEAAIGGPLALVRTGDRIQLSVENKTIELLVGDDELERRRSSFRSPSKPASERRGYDKIYAQEVLQADEGCDFAIMQPVRA